MGHRNAGTLATSKKTVIGEAPRVANKPNSGAESYRISDSSVLYTPLSLVKQFHPLHHLQKPPGRQRYGVTRRFIHQMVRIGALSAWSDGLTVC
jgi:hypothetical protein